MRIDVLCNGAEVCSFSLETGESPPVAGDIIKTFGRYDDTKRIRLFRVLSMHTNLILIGRRTWKRTSKVLQVEEISSDDMENFSGSLVFEGEESMSPSWIEWIESLPGLKDNKTMIAGSLIVALVLAKMFNLNLPDVVVENYNDIVVGLLGLMGLTLRRAITKSAETVQKSVARGR